MKHYISITFTTLYYIKLQYRKEMISKRSFVAVCMQSYLNYPPANNISFFLLDSFSVFKLIS